MSSQAYLLLADALLLLHFLVVTFVVGGFALVLAGLALDWRWVHNRLFRLLHLAAIAVVVLQSWLGVICPLTHWENRLRALAGEQAYSGSFIQYWLHKLLFFQAPPWVFTLVYTLFGAAVAATWWLGRRRNNR